MSRCEKVFLKRGLDTRRSAQALTLAVVTHNPTLADAAGRALTLRDGKIEDGSGY